MLIKPNDLYKFIVILTVCIFHQNLLQGSTDELREQLAHRDHLQDRHYFLDSLMRNTPEETELFLEAVLLKSELLRKENKDVEALLELKKISKNEYSSQFPEILGEAYLSTSEIYSKEKSFDLARNYLTEAYILFDGLNNLDLKAITLIKSADVEKREKNHTGAIRHLKQAHDIYLEQGKIYESIELAEKIGSIAYEGGEFLEAEKYLELALDGFDQTGNLNEQIKVLETLSGIYSFENRYDEKIFLQEKLILLSSAGGSKEKTTQYLEQLSITYSLLDRTRDALLVQEKAVNNLSEVNNVSKYHALIRLSELYKISNRQTDAILTLHEANQLARSLDEDEILLSCSKIISNFYKDQENWEKAHYYLAISDSISESLLRTKIRKLEHKTDLSNVLTPVVASNDHTDTAGTVLSTEWKYYFIGLCSLVVFLIGLLLFIQKKRKKIRQILEWRVYKRTKELSLLNSELNTYIYKSSHDLRNPLTSIKSLITLLKSEENFDQSVKYIGLIENCANQMDEILLNLSRAVDYKKVEVKIEQINFDNLKLELNQQDHSAAMDGFDISWNIREKAPFFSDPNLIKVILNKTILNSSQYRLGSSSDFCKVSITTDSSGACVCIEDNGQGIAEKVKGSVFDMFVKGTHKSKGAGLGLYLVKIASDKIRGKITLESEENKGSKLVFKLPNLA